MMALAAAPAQAALITLTPGSSFTGILATPGPGQPDCASCSASVTFSLSADGLQLLVSLMNTSTDAVAGQNLITAFGFDTTGDIVLAGKKNDPPTTLASIVYSGAFTSGWEVASKGASLNAYDLIIDTSRGVNDSLDDGDIGSALFTFLNPFSLLSIDGAAIHLQALEGGGSTKFVCCTTGEGEGGAGEEGEGGTGEGEGGSGGEGSGTRACSAGPVRPRLDGRGLADRAAKAVDVCSERDGRAPSRFTCRRQPDNSLPASRPCWPGPDKHPPACGHPSLSELLSRLFSTGWQSQLVWRSHCSSGLRLLGAEPHRIRDQRWRLVKQMRNLFAASGICALMALVSSPAEASLITLTPGSSFTGLIATPAVGQPACATCSALATFGLSADGLNLSVSLTNTSTDGIAGSINMLTAFGFETSPDIVLPGGKKNDPPTNLAGIAYSGDFATGWETTNKGGGLNYELVLNTQKGLNDALDGGDTGSAVFTFLNPLSALSLDAAGVHIQSMVDGNSVKLVCCTTGEGEGGGER